MRFYLVVCSIDGIKWEIGLSLRQEIGRAAEILPVEAWVGDTLHNLLHHTSE